MSTITLLHPMSRDVSRAVKPRSPRAAEIAMLFGIWPHPSRSRRRSRRGSGGGRFRAGRARATRRHDPRIEPAVATEHDLHAMLPQPGQIVLVCGPSGAGKSSLLRILRASATDSIDWRELPDIPAAVAQRVDGKPGRNRAPQHVVDCFPADRPVESILALLARVGLAEVWTYLRRPDRLSDGQRWRLRLALALDRAGRLAAPAPPQPESPSPAPSHPPPNPATSLTPNHSPSPPTHHPHGNHPPNPARMVFLIDEFAAVLDRLTAAVVARVLRRAVDSLYTESAEPGRAPSAIVATSHEDLIPALAPDLTIRCDFGGLTITRHEHHTETE